MSGTRNFPFSMKHFIFSMQMEAVHIGWRSHASVEYKDLRLQQGHFVCVLDLNGLVDEKVQASSGF